jgi:formate/nitrite transporter FocA (FNT family)
MEALLPPQMAERAETIGVAKASMDAPRLFVLAVPAGAFVAAGFEHSVANMYFVPYAIFVAALDPDWVRAHPPVRGAAAPTWSAFLVWNLAPVTLGNVIGGAVLVGAVYWFVYLRGRPSGSGAGSRES